MKIGVFDSGIGGITTLGSIMSRVHASYYYYMDNIHVPYGMRSVDELLSIGCNIIDAFMRVGVDIVVIACNTMSAMAGEALRTLYDVPIVCIEPAIMPALEQGGRTLVLSTPNTAHSMRLMSHVKGRDDILIVPSDSLATYIENNDLEMAKNGVNAKLAGRIVDNVVLGCTHYVYLRSYIEGLGYRVFEGNDGVARRVESISKGMGYGNNEENRLYLHITKPYDVEKIAKHMDMPIHFW